MPYLPINLWYTVVYPPVVNPKQHVGIEVVVVLQAVSITAYRRRFPVSVNAERRHAKFHPRLHVGYGVVELTYEKVDIVTSPVAKVFYTI